jgi:hypothetical protein
MGQSKIKEQRRLERNHVIGLLKGKNKKCDELLDNNKIKTKVYDANDALKIKNHKPDYITFFNSDTGEVLYTARGTDVKPTDLSGNV